ncbi:hypothetical protein ACFW4O_36195 [Streptomyces mutabilis]|uniref:hypothetical protein n=1 Tax=Streptomyces mutabilis TaxID=67332 RepID=UPI0036C49A53
MAGRRRRGPRPDFAHGGANKATPENTGDSGNSGATGDNRACNICVLADCFTHASSGDIGNTGDNGNASNTSHIRGGAGAQGGDSGTAHAEGMSHVDTRPQRCDSWTGAGGSGRTMPGRAYQCGHIVSAEPTEGEGSAW